MKKIYVDLKNAESEINRIKKQDNSRMISVDETVASIIEDVKTEGDGALFRYTEKFDKFRVNETNIMVTDEEISNAYDQTDDELTEIIRQAKKNIESYHRRQIRNSWFTTEDGTLLGQKITPLASVGIYVPGGKAAYPSSVLMNAIPARIAGVEKIIMMTPASPDGTISPGVLVAAKESGVDMIFKAGGSQAIAALAYGTNTVPRVDKITGPGNIYVAAAKKKVFGDVSIDSVAGPSEILVIADETADPEFIAADMMSQAEHDENASAYLVTTSEETADKVIEQIEKMLPALSRNEIIRKSLEDNCRLFIADTDETAFAVSDLIAPEHLEIIMKDHLDALSKIKNAGAVFLGSYSCEPLGDYFAGPNHVLPTGGTARFFSPLGVDDFIKKTSIIHYSKDALKKVRRSIEKFAEAEQLTAHANSISVRFEEE